MNKLSVLLTSLGFITATLAAMPALASTECERLAVPELNYSTGMEVEKVVAMQTAVKDFVASGDAYLECIEAERAAAGEEATQEQLANWLALYNSAVDEMKTTAEEFNVIVRQYKADTAE